MTCLRLLRLLRVLRLSRKADKIMTNSTLSIVLLMYLFVLLAHWLGMLWYNLAIKPMVRRAAARASPLAHRREAALHRP